MQTASSDPDHDPDAQDAGAQDAPASRDDRKFKIIAAVAAVALIGFLAYVVVSSRSSSSPPPGTFPSSAPPVLRAGTVAPTFTLQRLGGGTPVTLTTDRPAVVNFFASWCSHCRAELKAIATFAATDGGRVDVIGVDTSDPDTSRVEHLLSEAGATYPVGVDPTGQVATRYHLTGLPVTYFIDTQGRIAGTALGAQTTASLRARVARLSAGGSS